jgi:hypothetical protein
MKKFIMTRGFFEIKDLLFWRAFSLFLILVTFGVNIGNAGIDDFIFAEIPPNDFRISFMGPDKDTDYFACCPAVTYNSQRDEYLVVWVGLIPQGDKTDKEIFAQRVSPRNGSLIGEMLRTSYMGPYGDPGYTASYPDVAYNPKLDDYLVVWHGSDNSGDLIKGELEIWGQRVVYDQHDKLKLKGSRLRLSDMGPDGSYEYAASYPAVAYDESKNEFLVVWAGTDNTPPLEKYEQEIFGQYLHYSSDTLYHRDSDFRISFMGPDGDEDYDAYIPDVAYNSNHGSYLVVWHGDSHTFYQDNEYEIWGRRIFSDGSFDYVYPISDMGGIFNNDYTGTSPAVAFNPRTDEWFVVWKGNEFVQPSGAGEYEIYGQFLKYENNSFMEVGDNDFRISDMGPDMDINSSVREPAVAFDSIRELFLVVWVGRERLDGLTRHEAEVFAQLVDARTMNETGENDLRLSDVGPDGNDEYEPGMPVAAFSKSSNNFLIVWSGDDNTPPLVNDETEIFGQLFGAHTGRVYFPLLPK